MLGLGIKAEVGATAHTGGVELLSKARTVPYPGNSASGSRATQGASTNARSCARGCGRTSSGGDGGSATMTSTSRVRGPHRRGALATSTALGVLRSSPRLGRVTAANHHDVEEGVLRGDSDRARLEDRRHGARPKDLNGESKVCQAIAEVAAQGQHGGHGRVTVTATSRYDSGMGADGLCTVTSARMTLASWRHPSASRWASVSIRATGGPATVAASRCASCP